MLMQRHLNRHLRISAIKKALEMFGNGFSKDEIKKELLSILSDVSSSNAEKHIRDIFSNFLSIPTYFIEFYKKLDDNEREQFIHLILVKNNLFYRKTLKILASIDNTSVNWSLVKNRFIDAFPQYSEKTIKSEFSKAIYLLNQLGLLIRDINGYSIRRWPVSFSLFTFIIYLKYSHKKIVEISTILNDEDVTCMLWDLSERFLEELLQKGDGKYFLVEQVGPLNRIILKYPNIEKFVEVFND